MDEYLAVQHLRWCLDLHRRIAPDSGRPTCWSPYSVASALGLTTQTARRATRTELAALLLGEATDCDDALARYAALLASAAVLDNQAPTRRRLNRDSDPDLDPDADSERGPLLEVANTMWVDDRVTLTRAADERAWAVWPGAKVRQLPFSRDPEHSRSTINRDITNITHGLVRNLLPPGTVTVNTVATLVNALYLRTSWTTPFFPRRTVHAPFLGPAGAVGVEMMRVTAPMGYGHRFGWQIVDIPAAAGVAATVLLPDDSLDEAEPRLDGPRLYALTQAVRPQRVDLSLPRVRQRSHLSLTQVLEDSGVHTLFDRQCADLGGLTQDRLVVSDVLHQSVLHVDEQGLEGAAATAVTVGRGAAAAATPIVVRVDRPFLLAIRHYASGVVYFLARVTHP